MKFNGNLILYLLVSLVVILLFSQFFNMSSYGGDYDDEELIEDFRLRDLTPEQRRGLQQLNNMRPEQIKIEKERLKACQRGCSLLRGRDRTLCNQKCNKDLSNLMMYHGSLVDRAAKAWEKSSGLRLRDYRYSPEDDIGKEQLMRPRI